MTSTTRLEVDGKKFWEAVVEGKTVTLNFGKIGKEGKSSNLNTTQKRKRKNLPLRGLRLSDPVDTRMLKSSHRTAKKREAKGLQVNQRKREKDTVTMRKVARTGLSWTKKSTQTK